MIGETKKALTLKEVIDFARQELPESGDTVSGTHNFPATINATIDDDKGHSYFDVVGVKFDYAMGCNCEIGIILRLRRLR